MQSIDILQIEKKKGDIFHPKGHLPNKILDHSECLFRLSIFSFKDDKEGFNESSKNVAKGSFTKHLMSKNFAGIKLIKELGKDIHQVFNS